MKKFNQSIFAQKGFTLVELIVVIVMISTMTAVAIPGFMRGLRSARFEKVVGEVVVLFEKARTQALASEINSNQKISLGGYGVYLDFTSATPPINPTNQQAVLFVDDYNAARTASVNVGYGDDIAIANRVMPDGVYTPGSDSVLTTIEINNPAYIQMTGLKGNNLSDGSLWDTASGNTITVIFKPPFAETTIKGSGGVNLKSFEVEFKSATENTFRTIKLNRATTTPQVTKS